MDNLTTKKRQLLEVFELIKEQTEILNDLEGNIPQLYIDMLKKNIIKFYEVIQSLEISKDIIPEVKPVASPKIEKKTEPVPIRIKEKNKIAEPIEIKEEKVKIEKAFVEPPAVDDPLEKTKSETIQEPPPPIINFVKKTEKSAPSIKEILAKNTDLFGTTTPSIGDKLSAQQDPTLADKMQQTQFTDIKSAIGINDKFLFINELFEGNLKNYNDSINRLNSFTNTEEALSEIKNLQGKYNWEEENETLEKLKSIIERRY